MGGVRRRLLEEDFMNSNKSANIRVIIFTVIAIVLIILLAFFLFRGTGYEKISYDELLGKVASGQVYGVYFTDDYNCNVLYNSDAEKDEKIVAAFKKGKAASAVVTTTNRNLFTAWVVENYGDDIENLPFLMLNDPNSGSFFANLLPYISIGIIVVLAIILIVSMRGKGGNGAMNFGKTKARLNQNVKTKFTDVAGAEEEKEELKEIVEFLKSPQKFSQLGAKVPRGVLLVGPPGTGKTLFAKAVAGEANVPFFSMSGSDFVEMFVGVGASRVRELFAQAKKSAPCIIFIDEIDAVGRQRGAGLGGGNDEREQTLNQLLVQMDGFESSDNVIVMAATNRADVLDPALLRPGRFDRQIYINVPDVKGREEIFKVHARNKPIAKDVDFKNLARLTAGFSGANIENLLNEAAILAARENRKTITMHDISEGINKVIAGPQKKSRVITESDKRITAYHESGHAIVGHSLKYCDDVQEVSIIPRGMAAGYTISRPSNDNSHVTFNKLNDRIAMSLGGRIAEEIVIKDISTGASQDIKQVTELARQMVCEWGMSSELSTIYYGSSQEVFIGRDYQTQNTYSEAVAAVIDKEIKEIVERNYKRAKEILTEKRAVMDNMVKLLYMRDTIYQDEVDLLMEGKTAEEVNEFINEKLAKAAAEEAERKAAEEAAKKAAAEKLQQEIAAKTAAVSANKDENKSALPPASTVIVKKPEIPEEPTGDQPKEEPDKTDGDKE